MDGAENSGRPPDGPRHGGDTALAAALRFGVETMFTLSGGHVFPLYDAAVRTGTRIVDVRHEQSAVFAAEATARLARRPGLAVLTAGPGVTNGVSAIATAHFNGSPVVVLGGRAPAARWGSGALQELDHPPLVAPVTKLAATASGPGTLDADVTRAFDTALAPHRGPAFLDIHMDHLFAPAVPQAPRPERPPRAAGVPPLDELAPVLQNARRPVLVLGSDVWTDGAEHAARAFAEEVRVPVVANGQGRGVLPAGHDLLVTRARRTAFGEADLVIVAGTPLDFRLGYGVFGDARVVHLMDHPSALAAHLDATGVAGDLSAVFAALPRFKTDPDWLARLRDAVRAASAADAGLLHSGADPVHPLRVYGELNRILDDDAVVIGDGGDFVSYAGRYVEPKCPGTWLDPGPYGCLGTGLGYAMAARIVRPSAQVVLLLGDGAAGLSLMDADTLVRHRLPVVIIVGNNGAWGLEKHPMRALYGYDVAADLQPACRYDEVVRALGGAGETVTRPADLAAALRRAFAANVPYLVNVVTDPDIAYPRTTTGV
ncbi:acetolactate synthase [Actinomadura gamaensis]|uniref:Acetolactate synthase n=1 Tax=Actinomadura gamaensis TaxID=1763541 RepID=A0ABV9TPJ6_9ACTN